MDNILSTRIEVLKLLCSILVKGHNPILINNEKKQ